MMAASFAPGRLSQALLVLLCLPGDPHGARITADVSAAGGDVQATPYQETRFTPLGCAGIVKPGMTVSHVDMTVQKCYQHCSQKDLKVFGLFRHTHCICGYKSEFLLGRPSSDCPYVCGGVEAETCGGEHTATLFEIRAEQPESALTEDVHDEIVAAAERTGEVRNPEGADVHTDDSQHGERAVLPVAGKKNGHLPAWAGGLAWPRGEVVYRFARNEDESTILKWNDAMAAYTRHTCLRFREAQGSEFALLVTSQQKSEGAAGWSLLGYKGPVLKSLPDALSNVRLLDLFPSAAALDESFKVPLVQLQAEGKLTESGNMLVNEGQLPFGASVADLPGMNDYTKPSGIWYRFADPPPGFQDRPRNIAPLGVLRDLEAAGGPSCCGHGMTHECSNCQALQLNKECALGTAVHELGHSLGFRHSQSRSDRDKYIKVLWKNLGKDTSQYSTGTRSYEGPYDYGSIMHYSVWQGPTVPDRLYQRISDMISGGMPWRMASYFASRNDWPPIAEDYYGVLDYLHDNYGSLAIPLTALAYGVTEYGDALENELYDDAVWFNRLLSRRTLELRPSLCGVQEILAVGWDPTFLPAAYGVWDTVTKESMAKWEEDHSAFSDEDCGDCCKAWKKSACGVLLEELGPFYAKFRAIASKAAGFELTEVCGSDFGKRLLDALIAEFRYPAGWHSMVPVGGMPEGVTMGQRAALSQNDIHKVNEVYQCPQLHEKPVANRVKPQWNVSVAPLAPSGAATTFSVIVVDFAIAKQLASNMDRVVLKDARGDVVRSEVPPELSANNPDASTGGLVALHVNSAVAPDFPSGRPAEPVLPGDYRLELFSARAGAAVLSTPIRVEDAGPSRPGQATLEFDGELPSRLSWKAPLLRSSGRMTYSILRARISFDVKSHDCADKTEGGEPWKKPYGSGCEKYNEYPDWCESMKGVSRAGMSNDEACCICGGGVRRPVTEFGSAETLPAPLSLACDATWSGVSLGPGLHRVTCGPCATFISYKVYGDGATYSADSSLCYAGVHAGVAYEIGGTFFVKSSSGSHSFEAGESNGINAEAKPRGHYDTVSLSAAFDLEAHMDWEEVAVKDPAAEGSASVVAIAGGPELAKITSGCGFSALVGANYFSCGFKVVASAGGQQAEGLPTPLRWQDSRGPRWVAGVVGPVPPASSGPAPAQPGAFQPLGAEACPSAVCTGRDSCRTGPCGDCEMCDMCPRASLQVPVASDGATATLEVKRKGQKGQSLTLPCPRPTYTRGDVELKCNYGTWMVEKETCDFEKCRARDDYDIAGWFGHFTIKLPVGRPDEKRKVPCDPATLRGHVTCKCQGQESKFWFCSNSDYKCSKK